MSSLAGNTGVPFVDANMREILNTGWMSNRGRQNVASNLTKDYGIDWRYGAVWFESILVSIVFRVLEKVWPTSSVDWSWCLFQLRQLGLCSRCRQWSARESAFQYDQASAWLWSWGECDSPLGDVHHRIFRQGDYVRTWCPELTRLPNEYIHTPWLAPVHVLRDAGVELGVNYPRPLMVATQWNQQVNTNGSSDWSIWHSRKL